MDAGDMMLLHMQTALHKAQHCCHFCIPVVPVPILLIVFPVSQRKALMLLGILQQHTVKNVMSW